MATKIRRCLYIGLGGTGMKSILHTKKMFIDTYGEVPPMIGFLGIDTDGGEYNKALNSKYGEVRLEPLEQQTIQVAQPRPIYDRNEQSLTWFPKEQNYFALVTMQNGAGQIRSNGRFALWYNASKVASKINQSLSQILNASIIDNTKYEILADRPEIHMVFSLCGGTGCGTFINMAYLIREHCSAYAPSLMGYGVLPGIFRAQLPTQSPNVKANAYGALLDLDYLMNNNGTIKIHIDSLNDAYDTTERPFDAFTLIDNRNSRGDTYNNVDQLCEMIGLSLVNASGELSAASASTVDNMSKLAAAGDMDIKSGTGPGSVKRAWGNAMGVSQIVFHGQDLHRVYVMKAAQALARKLLTSDVDANAIANAWIDSPAVNIRENNGQDNVIDFMLPKAPPYAFPEVENVKNPAPEVNNWINAVTVNRDEVKNYGAKVTELSTRVNEELDKLVDQYLNGDGGVRLTRDILDAIDHQIDIFLGEMTEEKKELQSRVEQLNAAKQATINVLADYKKPLFGKNRTQEYIDDLSSAATNVAVNQREIVRRTAAITFFNGLKLYIAGYQTRLENLSNQLKVMIGGLDTEISAIQNSVGENVATFQIDLTPRYSSKVQVDVETLLVPDFIKTLTVEGGKPSLLNLLNCDKQQTQDIFLRYTAKTAEAHLWDSLTIDDVIERLPESELKNIINQAILKSDPLINIDYRGYTPLVEPVDYFYIGVYDKATSILSTKGLVSGQIASINKPEFCSIGSTDSIIFYRQKGVFPAFVIADVNSYESEYSDDRRTINYHIDRNLQIRMQREGFSLFPTEAEDDSLRVWIMGFLLGVIRNQDGTYQFQDMEHGDPLDDYWTKLAGEANDRAAAFQDFKGRLATGLHDQLTDTMNKKHTAMGDEAFGSLINDVKAGANYFTKYGQINMTNEQLKARGWENVANQVRTELDYVRKEL